MELDPRTCYRALQAHDARFDGVFFVAVTTTGVYCRPICPARVPAAARCQFYRRAAEAERAGFRACFRCRPELAPRLRTPEPAGGASVDAITRLVSVALGRIESGYLNEASVDQLAGGLGVTARHLRRAMESRLGVTPVELAQTQRLALAKHLLAESTLSLSDIAFASGFASLRRFNALFRERFGKSPSLVRRDAGGRTIERDQIERDQEAIALRLDYRPPLAWDELLGFLAARAVPGVERVLDGEYLRTVRIGERSGWLAVRPATKRSALAVRVSLSLAPVLTAVVARLRALFDLDAQPTVIAEHLRQDPLLGPLVAARPGLRVPGAFDGFELAVRAILGQQVSVVAATTVAGRIVQRFGTPPRVGSTEAALGIGFTFPSAERLAQASIDDIAGLGMPGARARTILELSRALASAELDLDPSASPHAAIARLEALPGVGPWTAHYIALRALHWPNAFPAADLGVKRALGVASAKAAEARSAPWQPWRAYAVLHLWSSLAQGG